MGPMVTFEQVSKEMKMGRGVASRTFWRYIALGLLPKGVKLRGHGNILFFPEDTAKRIAQIEVLKKDYGLPLRLLRKSSFHFLQHESTESLVNKSPSAVDLIVWWAGVMARLDIQPDAKLSKEDLGKVSEEGSKMFAKLSQW